jgi:hypothetical protein
MCGYLAELETAADAIDMDRRGRGDQDDAVTQTPPPAEMRDRDLVALHVKRIVLRSRSIEITLQNDVPEGTFASKIVQIPWLPTCCTLARESPGSPRAHHHSIPSPA